jgi:hypothetical protein
VSSGGDGQRGVDAATAAAMKYAMYLDYQRDEGWKD